MDIMELKSKIRIYTSYFARHKNKPNGVSIAINAPWWKGEKYPDLYPRKALLNWWKSVKDTEENRYIYKYMYQKDVLSKLDVNKVAKDLDGKVLLCFESSEKFCHRHIVAQWFRDNGYCCEEIFKKL